MSDEHDDKDHEHDKHHAKELNDLVRTLIEAQVAGNELLAGLNRKIATTICILEHISKNTCETLNKLHELAECKETGVCEPCRPAEVCCAKPPVPPPEKPEEPCRPEKPERPCKYEPCKPSEDGGGSDVSRPGAAPPQRVFGAPYPPVVRPDNPPNSSERLPGAENTTRPVSRIFDARRGPRAAEFLVRRRRRRGRRPGRVRRLYQLRQRRVSTIDSGR